MANITKTYVEREAVLQPGSAQSFYYDDLLRGFGVRVTKGSKSFILDRKFNGKSIRITIGRFPDWSVQQAKEQARGLIVQLDKGIDVRLAAKSQAAAGVKLKEIFEAYLSERDLKQRTKDDYKYYMSHYMEDWLERPINSISPEMVVARYKKVAASSSGSAQASSAMRALRAIFNYAIAVFGREIIPTNPVLTLSERRIWIRDQVKSDHLAPLQVGPFLRALRGLSNEVMGSYLEFILLTGARRREASKLSWRDIDLEAKVLTFRDTKSRTDRSIPITPRVEEILRKMQGLKRGPYVFAADDKDGKPSFVKDPRKALQAANKAANSSVTVHGLRRTFATVLESLDCGLYPLKMALGHSLRGDVTSNHYAQISIERVRDWMERYEGKILSL